MNGARGGRQQVGGWPGGRPRYASVHGARGGAVMAGPGDRTGTGSGGRGYLRASHADREQVIGVLKAAFVAGMLAKDEFDLRVGQTLASRTHAQLAGLTADLPAGTGAAPPPESARPRSEKLFLRPGHVITWATMLYAAGWLYAPAPAAPAMAVLGGFFYLCVVAIAMAVPFERRDKRYVRQLPQGHVPGAAGSAFRHLPPGGQDNQLPPVDRGHRHAA